MKITVFFKAFFWFGVLAIVLLSTVLIYSIDTIRDHYIETLTGHLANLSSALGLTVLPLVENSDLEELDRIAREFDLQTGTRITVIDRSGTVIIPGELDVQGDILNFQVHGVYEAELEGTAGSEQAQMVKTEKSICFLTRTRMEDILNERNPTRN